MSEDKNLNLEEEKVTPKYEPPTIKVVKLDTEVMLKSNCKSAGGANKPGRGCTTAGSCANNTSGS
jgi:hypothetical protein